MNISLEFKLNDEMLSDEEKIVFEEYLKSIKLGDEVWEVYNSLFASASRVTRPMMLRVYQNADLIAAVVLVKCTSIGQSLFANPILAKIVSLIRFPCYLWVNNICSDGVSNPGFFRSLESRDSVIRELVNYFRKSFIFTCIVDRVDNSRLYSKADVLPYVDNGIIQLNELENGAAYIRQHKNIKHKINKYQKNDGVIVVLKGKLSPDDTADVEKCIRSIEKISVIYTPFQDIYSAMAVNIAKIQSDKMVHFIARLSGEFIGYHTFIQSGDSLNLVTGAFNRDRETNYHAYEVMLAETVSYGKDEGLKLIRYGPIFNLSKDRMMKHKEPFSYYLYSKYLLVQKLVCLTMKISKLQNKKLLNFSNKSSGHERKDDRP